MYQPSQNAYYLNYYNQVYNVTNYNPRAPNPYYPNGAYGMTNPNRSSPNIYQNQNQNSNYRGVPRPLEKLKLDIALNRSSYSSNNRDLIRETVLDNFSDNTTNRVYLQSSSNDKIFIILKNINCKLVNKAYNIPIIIHLPASYPNTPPEFYIQRKPKVCINKAYYENQKILYE